MIYVVVDEAHKKYENCESLREPRVHDSRQTLLRNSSIIRTQRFNYANYLDKGSLCDIQVASRLNLHDHTSGMESLLPRQRTKFLFARLRDGCEEENKVSNSDRNVLKCC